MGGIELQYYKNLELKKCSLEYLRIVALYKPAIGWLWLMHVCATSLYDRTKVKAEWKGSYMNFMSKDAFR